MKIPLLACSLLFVAATAMASQKRVEPTNATPSANPSLAPASGVAVVEAVVNPQGTVTSLRVKPDAPLLSRGAVVAAQPSASRCNGCSDAQPSGPAYSFKFEDACAQDAGIPQNVPDRAGRASILVKAPCKPSRH